MQYSNENPAEHTNTSEVRLTSTSKAELDGDAVHKPLPYEFHIAFNGERRQQHTGKSDPVKPPAKIEGRVSTYSCYEA